MNRIAVGDPIIVRTDRIDRQGEVVALAIGSWILARTADGRLWLEVVMDLSAVSWSRLALLEHNLRAEDTIDIERIAQAIARRPHRNDAADVPGVQSLCAAGDEFVTR